MNLKDAEKKLFKPEEADLADLVKVEVPIVDDPAYDANFLRSEKLEELEEGIRQAKKVGDFAWYAIAVSLAKIIDGGLYSQAGLTQSQYREVLQERLGLDKRRVSDFLQAGRFLIDHGQKLLSMGWKPEGMQAKIRLANSAKKSIKNESKLIDAIINRSLHEFRDLIRKNNKKSKPSGLSCLAQKDGKLFLDGKEILSATADLPEDLAQDIQMIFEALIESRSHKGRIACFAVENRRQAQNAPRIFRDFINGKFKKA